MKAQIMNSKKTLTNVKLVNWHYFQNETIPVQNSTLFIGETGAGKSTILDAIQLVLTTDSDYFNRAANDSSKRDLRGYVRGKTGVEGNAYLRNGSVISYVALEFFEESKHRYFVIGVKLDSSDKENSVEKKWFCEECSLEALSFIVDNKPATDDVFKNNGKKVNFIHRVKEAKDRFRYRLGGVDENFIKILQKALAFKPMKNVKSFINEFVLPEVDVDVENLRKNIRSYKELEGIIATVKKQKEALEEIISDYNKCKDDENLISLLDIYYNELELHRLCENLKLVEDKIIENQRLLEINNGKQESKRKERDDIKNLRTSISASIENNDISKLINNLKNQIQVDCVEKKHLQNAYKSLKNQLEFIKNYLVPLTGDLNLKSVQLLCSNDIELNSKIAFFEEIKIAIGELENKLGDEKYSLRNRVDSLNKEINQLNDDMEKLRKNKIIYPSNTLNLQQAIQKEFKARSIVSDVWVFADLLDVKEPEWQNAVEGYLKSQKFYLLVEPEYYDIAAEVYDKVKNHIHSVGLVNTKSLDLSKQVEEKSLACVVKSGNRYARAYANYVLGRVYRCDSVADLQHYDISITKECMLYQGKVLRKINEDDYKIPYIGKSALVRQKELTEEKLTVAKTERDIKNKRLRNVNMGLNDLQRCNLNVIEENLNVPSQMREINRIISEKKIELEKARMDPSILELLAEEDRLKKIENNLDDELHGLVKESGSLESEIKSCCVSVDKVKREIQESKEFLNELSGNDESLVELANKTFKGYKKTVVERERKKAEEALKKHTDTLWTHQINFEDGEYGKGLDVMTAYFDAYEKIIKDDLINCNEKIIEARKNCELEFKESFLSKMQENIRNAEDTFRSLNKKLSAVAYGNDVYRFKCGANPNKANLYKMLTSNLNLGGDNLFLSIFEEDYKSELDDLFDKLTESDEQGESVVKEYTDYRNYLDYDIEIHSKNNEGRYQLFSKIYGEKSGGETQTPYYVAIAAAFLQTYGYGESIRIIMMDEAFDKMDNDRISSMMEFFNNLEFQVILATPPQKLEVIGEHVDTVITVFKDGFSSMVEKYEIQRENIGFTN